MTEPKDDFDKLIQDADTDAKIMDARFRLHEERLIRIEEALARIEALIRQGL